MTKITAERKMISWASKSAYSIAIKDGCTQELCSLITVAMGLCSPAVGKLFQAVQDAKEQCPQVDESWSGATSIPGGSLGEEVDESYPAETKEAAVERLILFVPIPRLIVTLLP